MFFKGFGSGFTSIDYLELVACADGTDVEVFFGEISDRTPPAWWKLEINGQPSDQPIGRLNFKAGDVIKVTHGGLGGMFAPISNDYFSEVRGALPIREHLDYIGFMRQCWNLRTVPSTLFVNLKNMGGFGLGRLFEQSGIESVPEDIFVPYGTRTGSLNWTFSECRNLRYLHPNTFAHFDHIGDMHYTFENTDLHNVTLRINATTCDTYDGTIGPIAPGVPDGELTLIVKRGTRFAQAIKNDRNSNIRIVEE